MNALIYISASLVVLSKFLDCLTTAWRIRTPTMERNPIARRLMIRFGTHATIWGVFAVSIAITALSLWLVLTFYNTPFYRITFIVIALILSLVQFAVALNNHSGRVNGITRVILKISTRKNSN